MPGTCGLVRGARLQTSEVYWKAILFQILVKYYEVLVKKQRFNIPVLEETDLFRVSTGGKL